MYPPSELEGLGLPFQLLLFSIFTYCLGRAFKSGSQAFRLLLFFNCFELKFQTGCVKQCRAEVLPGCLESQHTIWATGRCRIMQLLGLAID